MLLRKEGFVMIEGIANLAIFVLSKNDIHKFPFCPYTPIFLAYSSTNILVKSINNIVRTLLNGGYNVLQSQRMIYDGMISNCIELTHPGNNNRRPAFILSVIPMVLNPVTDQIVSLDDDGIPTIGIPHPGSIMYIDDKQIEENDVDLGPMTPDRLENLDNLLGGFLNDEE